MNCRELRVAFCKRGIDDAVMQALVSFLGYLVNAFTRGVYLFITQGERKTCNVLNRDVERECCEEDLW